MSLMEVVAALIVFTIGISAGASAWSTVSRYQQVNEDRYVLNNALDDAADQYLHGILTTDSDGTYMYVEGPLRVCIHVTEDGTSVQLQASIGNQVETLRLPGM